MHGNNFRAIGEEPKKRQVLCCKTVTGKNARFINLMVEESPTVYRFNLHTVYKNKNVATWQNAKQ